MPDGRVPVPWGIYPMGQDEGTDGTASSRCTRYPPMSPGPKRSCGSAAPIEYERLAGGSLRDAILTGSTWTRAALLGIEGLDELMAAAELGAAAIAGHDPAEVMIRSGGVTSLLAN